MAIYFVEHISFKIPIVGNAQIQNIIHWITDTGDDQESIIVTHWTTDTGGDQESIIVTHWSLDDQGRWQPREHITH